MTSLDTQQIPWSADEDAKLWRLKIDDGLLWPEVAPQFPNRTLHACRSRMTVLRARAKDLGLKKTTPKIWSAAENATFRRMVDAGKSDAEIAAEMPGRTLRAVQCQRHMLRSNQRIETLAVTERRINLDRARAIQREAAETKPASITAWLLGDPPPGRSALDRKRMGVAEERVRMFGEDRAVKVTLPERVML